MNMQKWHETVAELAKYSGLSVEQIGEMRFAAVSALYAAMVANEKATCAACRGTGTGVDYQDSVNITK